MLCSIGHGELPNLNFWLAPSCCLIGTHPLDPQLLKQQNISSPFNPYLCDKVLFTPYIPGKSQILVPKKVYVKVIENNSEEVEEKNKDNKEKNFKKLFEVSNCEVSHDTVSNLSTHDSHDSHDIHDFQYNVTHEHDHYFDLNFITENDITKFNNDQKLKKIHSTYHLKRKVSTKFQNQVKIYANNLIMECSKNMPNLKIPFLFPCTKIFREDVKIDTFKKIKNLTIDKYINEDIQGAGRSLNIKNAKILELIKDIYEKNNENIYIKKLNNFLFKTIVIDYYNEFLESKNFKSCLEKDLEKYVEKLKTLKYSEDKISLYKKIFKEKYEGIARYLFYNN